LERVTLVIGNEQKYISNIMTQSEQNVALTCILLLACKTFHDIDKINNEVREDNRWLEKELGMKIDNYFAIPKSRQSFSLGGYIDNRSGDQHTVDIYEWIKHEKLRKLQLIRIIEERNASDGVLKNKIKREFEMTLLKIESNISNKINDWKKSKRGSQIECAAFCELLFKNGFFSRQENRIQTCTAFAKFRYGIDIKNQLQKTKEAARKRYQIRLNRLFK
jgi:hypothetical protein